MRPSEPQPGELVADKYVIERELGRGGMGVVYRARHRITDRVVALKWLLEDDPQRRERFLREARAMGRLAHPNVVGVLDVGEHEGATFLVMDYLEGKSLREVLDAGRCETAQAIRYLMPALSGVAAAHQAGLLHRDLKPENLFVLCDHDGTPYDTTVLDFGVAKPFGQDHGQASLTHSGAIVGTPRYMAPEQLGEETELDPRCDLYSLGIILYELLTGELPYRAKSLNALLLEILTGDVRSPKELNDSLPEELCEVVLKALARKREDRFEDVAAFARALEPFGEVRFEAPRNVHTPRHGETDPDVVERAREVARSHSGASAPRPSLPETKSDKPPARTKAYPRPGAAISGTEPTVEAASLDTSAPVRPSRSPVRTIAIGGAILVVLGLGVALAWPPASSERVEPPPSAPVVAADPAPVVEPAPPPAPDEVRAALSAELPVALDPPEPEPEPEAEPSAPRRRPRRTERPPVAAPEPAAEEPGLRVQTRAGTLESDDF